MNDVELFEVTSLKENEIFINFCSQLDSELDVLADSIVNRDSFSDVNKIQPSDICFLLRYKNSYIGSAALRIKTKNIWEIKRVFILHRFRRKGFGKILISLLLDYVKNNKGKTVILEVGTYQIPAIRLYEALGFVQIPNYEPYVNSNISNCYKIDLEEEIIN